MTTIKPEKSAYFWIVQSQCGRDRYRYFLAFPCEGGENMRFPAFFTVNGTSRPVETPKMKHIAHVRVVAEVSEEEKNLLHTDYSNKTVAILIEKYDKYGELLKKREKTQKSS